MPASLHLWLVFVRGFLLWELFFVCCVFSPFFVFLRHTCFVRWPRVLLAASVRLIIENDMRIDSLQVIASLPNFQPDITCVVPLFGGKCIDITLRDHKVTARLAASGFDYGDLQKLQRLLGKRAIHVPWFVRAEFPENVVVNLLKQYCELKTENVRRLYF